MELVREVRLSNEGMHRTMRLAALARLAVVARTHGRRFGQTMDAADALWPVMKVQPPTAIYPGCCDSAFVGSMNGFVHTG